MTLLQSLAHVCVCVCVLVFFSVLYPGNVKNVIAKDQPLLNLVRGSLPLFLSKSY